VVGGAWEVEPAEVVVVVVVVVVVGETLMTSWCAFLRFRTSAWNLPSPRPKSVFSLVGVSFLVEVLAAVREVEVRLVGAGVGVEAKKVEVF
jgi:hypothetical protein